MIKYIILLIATCIDDYINRWRAVLQPKTNSKLIDMAAGTGDITKIYLERINFEGHSLMVDQNSEMLNEGKKKLSRYKNIDYLCAKAEDIPAKESSFDYYTISFGIRNVSDIKKTLSEAYRVLKPGGRFMCLEFSEVEVPVLKQFYDFYSFNVIPGLGKLLANDSESYQYLVESIRQFPKQKEFASLIEDAGFKCVTYTNLTGGMVAVHSGFKIW